MPSDSAPVASANRSREVALSVRDLVETFLVGGGVFGDEKGEVSAVAGVSFDTGAGRTPGLVGESGCEKSTTARSILRLIKPTSGEAVLTPPPDGGGSERIDVIAADRRQLRELLRHMQIVFQDPFASLNPRMSVGTPIGELLHVHTDLSRTERRDRVGELLSLVGMNPNVADRYPHEFSGRQRRRIGVARALALNPGFLTLDEPVSALDVSIQAQVLSLLEELKDRLGLTYLFIVHHLGGRAAHLLRNRRHAPGQDRGTGRHRPPVRRAHPSKHAGPALGGSDLQPEGAAAALKEPAGGDAPSPLSPPSRRRFHTRRPIGRNKQICRAEEPILKEEAPDHLVDCHFTGAGGII